MSSDRPAPRPREPGELRILRELRLALTSMRALSGVESSADIDLDALEEVERAIDLRLPSDVLALLASGVPTLRRRYRLGLDELPALAARARARGLPPDRVAIAFDRERDRYWCISVRERGTGGRSHLVAWPGPGDQPLLEWVEREHEALRARHLAEGARGPDALHRARAESALAGEERVAFRPRLVRRVPADAGPAGDDVGGDARSDARSSPRPARVSHAKYGAGSVLSREGSGDAEKLLVRFDEHVEKRLLARFVTTID